MTTASLAVDTDLAPPPVRRRRNYRIQPVRALKALSKLRVDKEDTFQVFEIMRALSGRSIPNAYERMLTTPEGGRQALAAVELEPKLSDRAWVASFAPGTVGAHYREFIAKRDISAEGLAMVSREAQTEVDAPHPYAWMGRRIRDVHDIWHVLTGYGTDALGEGCVVAFSYAQTRSLGFGLMAAAGASEFSRIRPGLPYAKAVWQAYRSGRRAAWLPAQDYEALLAEPLEAARTRLNIRRPWVYESIPAALRDGFQTRPAMAA